MTENIIVPTVQVSNTYFFGNPPSWPEWTYLVRDFLGGEASCYAPIPDDVP